MRKSLQRTFHNGLVVVLMPEDHWKIPWAVALATLNITKFRVIALCI